MKKSDAKPNTKSCDRILHILFPFLFFLARRSARNEGRRQNNQVEVNFNAIGSREFVGNEKSSVCIRFVVEECGGINKHWPTQTKL